MSKTAADNALGLRYGGRGLRESNDSEALSDMHAIDPNCALIG